MLFDDSENFPGTPPPDEKELELAIGRLNNIDLWKLEIEEIIELLRPLRIGLLQFAYSLAIGQFLYRGRKVAKKVTNMSELSYPPSEVVGWMRANRPNNPIFYCSTDGVTVLSEISAEVGDMVLLSKWKCLEKFYVNNIGYTMVRIDLK
ncbi:MAG: hypothetical protein IT259_19235 [Saprospiraceae bacterium]|nr:hypothetical protein [Saprospiraceae bacterium]